MNAMFEDEEVIEPLHSRVPLSRRIVLYCTHRG